MKDIIYREDAIVALNEGIRKTKNEWTLDRNMFAISNNRTIALAVERINALPSADAVKDESKAYDAENPKCDLIYREDAVEAFADMRDGYIQTTGEMLTDSQVIAILKALPSADISDLEEVIKCKDLVIEELTKNVKSLSADRPMRTKDDLVNAFAEELTNEDVIRAEEYAKGYVDGQTDRPMGEWIESDIPNEKYRCSVCGGACWYYDFRGDVAKSNYCPNCGARMTPYKGGDTE